MEIIVKIDVNLVMKCFERFSHWTQRTVGLDCFFWAYMANGLMAVYSGIMTAGGLFFGLLPQTILPGIFFVATMFCFAKIRTVKQQAYKGLARGMKNAMLYTLLPFRIISLFLSACCLLRDLAHLPSSGAYGIVFLLNSLIFATWLYGTPAFMSCTPLPPGESRLRKSIKRMTSLIKKVLSPSGEAPLPTPA